MIHTKHTWRHAWRVITTLVAVIAILCTSVGPSNAAVSRTVVPVSSGIVLLQPTNAQRTAAMNRLEQSRLRDAAGFDRRLLLIKNSGPLTTFLSSDSRFDSKLQQEFLAAAMPSDVLEALVELTDSGYLKLVQKDGPNGTNVVKVDRGETIMVGGGIRSKAVKPMFQQCPSAWAAFWAWWGTNIAFCGAMGFFGPMAALGCSFAMGVAGSVIDFNRGCRR